MEKETRFDLNAAVENWRNELAAQPNLATDDRRELETHLRDAIAGFQQRGLNDEESFWLARKRVGQPQQIGEEFVKANPNQIWRERLFWMIAGFWLFGLLILIVIPTEESFLCYFSNWYGFFEAHYSLLFCAHVLAITALVTSGRLARRDSWLVWLFQSRLRLITAVFIITMAACFFRVEPGALGSKNFTYTDWLSQTDYILTIYKGWFFSLLIPLVWLMPPQNRKTPKRA